MSDKANICCIVVTYNGIHWIDKCLSSIQSVNNNIFVVVVDNNSHDGTDQYVVQKFPDAYIIKNDKNMGFGHANNIGFVHAFKNKYDYVLLLNQDAYLSEGCIDILVQALADNSNYGIVSPFHLSYDGDNIETYFKDFILNKFCSSLIEDLFFQRAGQVYSVAFIHAAIWLMRADILKMVGGFDPLFFHYGEDVDFIKRTHIRGCFVGIVPSAKAYHAGTHAAHSNTLYFRSLNELLFFKQPSERFSSLFWMFLKKQFGRLVWPLLSFSFLVFVQNFKLLLKVMLRLAAVRKSRREMFLEYAYLHDLIKGY